MGQEGESGERGWKGCWRLPQEAEDTDAHGPPRAGKNLSEAASGAGFSLNPLWADQGRAVKVWPWEEPSATNARTS